MYTYRKFCTIFDQRSLESIKGGIFLSKTDHKFSCKQENQENGDLRKKSVSSMLKKKNQFGYPTVFSLHKNQKTPFSKSRERI